MIGLSNGARMAPGLNCLYVSSTAANAAFCRSNVSSASIVSEFVSRGSSHAERRSATTELPKVIAESGGGYVDNDVARLIGYSRELLRDRDHAAELSRKARAYARERFAIERFVADWNDVFHEATSP